MWKLFCVRWNCWTCCYNWSLSNENVPSNMRKMRRFRSARACASSGNLLSIHIFYTVVSYDSDSGQWRPWSDCADAQADLGLPCPHMPAVRICPKPCFRMARPNSFFFCRLTIEVKVYCDPNYFGRRCDVYCKPRDDHMGHYVCSPNDGDKICKPGTCKPLHSVVLAWALDTCIWICLSGNTHFYTACRR